MVDLAKFLDGGKGRELLRFYSHDQIFFLAEYGNRSFIHFHRIGCATGGWRVVDEKEIIELGDDTNEDGNVADEKSASMDIFMMILR